MTIIFSQSELGKLCLITSGVIPRCLQRKVAGWVEEAKPTGRLQFYAPPACGRVVFSLYLKSGL